MSRLRTMLNMAALAPIPTASESTATATKLGLRPSTRMTYRKSVDHPLSIHPSLGLGSVGGLDRDGGGEVAGRLRRPPPLPACHPPAAYSSLSVRTGSTRLARTAGKAREATATRASTMGAVTNVPGSRAGTP